VYKGESTSGAEITVTRAKVYSSINKIVKATVDDFKVGDCMPMAATLQPVPEIDSELSSTGSAQGRRCSCRGKRLSTSQHATSVRTPRQQSGGRDSRWWIFGQDSIFTLPCGR
jgi:hypothetical protein